MAVTITPNILMTASETLADGVDAIQSPTFAHSQFNVSGVTLNGTSTPPVSKPSYQTYALVAGALTVDLTALLGINDAAVNANTLDMVTLILINPKGNGALTMAPGAANDYQWMSTHSLVLPGSANQDNWVAFSLDGLGAVGATDKNIDFSGTGSETFKLGMTFG